MESLQTFITDDINDNYWKIIPFLLIAAGFYFAWRTILVQIRMIPDMFRAVVEKNDTLKSHTDAEGIGGFNWLSQHPEHGGVRRWLPRTGVRRPVICRWG
ncbi:hypothetical protein ACQX1N_03610, partial [Corynebacterium diphtheriae]